MSSDILSLAETARLLRLSRITLYRLARQGKLTGRKIGHSWRFHREEVEAWIRERQFSSRMRKILQELTKRFVAVGNGHVRAITLFGSHARGEATEESDLDLLVLVDTEDPRLEDQFHAAAYEVMRRFGFKVVVTLMVMTADHFAELGRLGYSLYRSLKREGQPLWRAA